MAYDLVIRGDVVAPGGVIPDGFVAVGGGIIQAVGRGEPPAADAVHDARGAWVLPGAIDAHVHSGSLAGQEGLGPLSRSAAAGGVTTVLDMPYDDPDPVTSVEGLREKGARVDAEAVVDVGLYATVPKEGGAERVAPLAAAGAAAFKLSTYETHPVRFPRIPHGEILEILQAAAATGRTVVFHAEDQELVDHLTRRLRAAGRRDALAHGAARPPLAELLAMDVVLELGAWTGARVHIAHCSVGRGIARVQHFREQGAPVSVETCIHYLTLAEEDMPRLGARAKINPPLRPWDEVEALWEQLQAGRVDCITSDHAPWPLERKQAEDIFENASGAPGVETLLPLLLTAAVYRRGWPIEQVIPWVSAGPARQFGLFPRKGVLRPGADADVAVVESRGWFFDGGQARSSAGWSPYDGMELACAVRAAFLRGLMVYDGRDVTAPAGTGHWLRPGPGSGPSRT